MMSKWKTLEEVDLLPEYWGVEEGDGRYGGRQRTYGRGNRVGYA
jgi:uncharacterized protein YndB with AHSA1/START domain